ncbi:MAG TPA: phospholipase D-like domain-containing protein [Rhabdochlamydiaceae bacterium]|nr:phospholipase D-like domain-containing protein [Rhabdochlamydiaceae bacterium]
MPSFERCVLAAKKSKILLSLFSLAALYLVLIRAALNPSLPSPENPLVFYSNQKRDDFRLVLKKAFADAQKSIAITMYAITDEELLKKLYQKAHNGVSVRIWHDPKSGSTPVSTPLVATAVKTKGLMHRKIITTDESHVFIGSANMTTSSLVLHDNLSVGFYHPPLAQFLKSPTSPYFDFNIHNQSCRLWMLPDLNALDYLMQQLDMAESSIFVAMFTLTHPDLLQALVNAQKRGVQVSIALDHYAARGASKKAVAFLQNHHIPVTFSQGQQLLHHKWAYIDRSQLILGSTNWTKAAFAKNQDCLVFFKSLTLNQKKIFDDLSRTILLEGVDQ